MTRSRRFTRYMLRELLSPTLLGLLLYTFVLLMNHFFLVAEKALSKNLGFELTLRLFLVGIPRLLVMSIPMAVLLGTLIAVGRLAADHEWVALQASGNGLAVVLRPVLLHGLLWSLASFVIYAVVVPETHYAFRNLRAEILYSSNLASDLRPRVFYDLPQDAVLFVDDIRPGGQRRLENVLLIQPDRKAGTTQMVLSRYGDLYPAPDGSGALIIDFYDGQGHIFKPEQPAPYRFSVFQSLTLRIDPPRFLQALLDPPNKVAQDLTVPELWDELQVALAERQALVEDRHENAGARAIMAQRKVSQAKVELHQRVALPLAAFVFAFLALPLGLGVRSGKGAGFAMSVVVILLYRIVFVLSRNQAVNGKIPADLGPWVADALMIVLGLLALWRIRRGTGQGRLTGYALALVSRVRAFLTRPRAVAAPAASVNGDDSTADLIALGGTPRRFVARLDRYIGQAYFRVLLFALISTYLVYAIVELQELMDAILRTRQPLTLIFEYFKYFWPGVLHIVLPVSCLVGAIVAFTLLTRTSEIVAIKASGVSVRRATIPVLLLTIVMCGLLFLVQDRIAPAASRKAQEIKDQILSRASRTHGPSTTGSWSFGPDGTTLYHYLLYDPERDEYRALSVFGLDRSVPRVEDYGFSDRARWNGEAWELEGGWFRSFEPRPGGLLNESTAEVYEGTRVVQLDLPHNLERERHRLPVGGSDDLPDQMSVSELREQIRSLSASGYDVTKFRVAYYGKFAHAVAPLVMVLLGLPFSFKFGKRGSLYGIGVALLLVLVYWATFAVFNALGLETLLRPPVAAWAPNVLYGLLGIYLLLYVRT